MALRAPHRWRTVVLGLALVGACGDDEVVAPAAEQGVFLGVWAGRPWVGDAHALLLQGAPEGDVLYVTGGSPPGADAFRVEESVSARVAFDGPGVYVLEADDVSFKELVWGDGIAAWYTGAGSPAGVLRISRYDPSTRAIEGELSFAAQTDSPHASYGTSARLEDGTFRAVLTVHPFDARAR